MRLGKTLLSCRHGVRNARVRTIMRNEAMSVDATDEGLLTAGRPAAAAREPERQRGIDRVITLLEALLRQRAPMRIGELARSIGAPRSTCYEIVNRLVEAEILEPAGADGQIYFGRAAYLFGRAYVEANGLHRRAVDMLETLAADTGVTAQLCALRGRKYVVLDARSGSALFRITGDIGAEVPIPWTASGRLLLGHLTPGEILDFVPPEDFLLPGGRALPVETFLAEVETARRNGFSVMRNLVDSFATCLAAPVFDARGVATATLCLVIPADVGEERIRALIDRLVPAARQLSAH